MIVPEILLLLLESVIFPDPPANVRLPEPVKRTLLVSVMPEEPFTVDPIMVSVLLFALIVTALADEIPDEEADDKLLDPLMVTLP